MRNTEEKLLVTLMELDNTLNRLNETMEMERINQSAKEVANFRDEYLKIEAQEKTDFRNCRTIVILDDDKTSNHLNNYFIENNIPFHAICKGARVRGITIGNRRPKDFILLCDVDRESRWYDDLKMSMESYVE
ncbi:hypothetical protein LCM23_14610 [Cytobacillus kochii]|uniref:hypothetical protein n=1 Tax=Cytobacillus kochii TaxID=859143 RepID=UPI001CD369A6|nr:hypothetical protein [Cytobacillus kochii]MCA1027329.1 hypothetical protein [Cytobacillus kochii]